jgi:propanol-preferring alcohol dehydrogenase
MLTWVVDHPAPIDQGPLRRIEEVLPEPGAGEVRVRVSCCGVCRTDLHLAEGDLSSRRPSVAPGHEIVGVVDAVGSPSGRFAIGDRIGVPLLLKTRRTVRHPSHDHRPSDVAGRPSPGRPRAWTLQRCRRSAQLMPI